MAAPRGLMLFLGNSLLAVETRKAVLIAWGFSINSLLNGTGDCFWVTGIYLSGAGNLPGQISEVSNFATHISRGDDDLPMPCRETEPEGGPKP